VQTLCLEVDQSFPEVTNPELEEITPKVRETTQRVLAALGLQFVEGSCDATLAITITGKAIGETYLNAGFCYEGAEVNGEIHLTIPGRTPLTVPISSRTEPPSMIREDMCAKEPYLAPFSLTWLHALFNGLAELWGPDVFIATMWDDDWKVSSAAIELMGRMEPVEGAVPALIQILESDEFIIVRQKAAVALGGMGKQEGVVASLIRVLEDEDEDAGVRMGAAIALMQIGEDATDSIPVLIQVLLDEDDAVLSPLAAQALGQIGPDKPEVLSALIQALEEEWSFVRKDAAETLGQLGPRATEAIPSLINALGDEERLVRDATAEALRAITGQDFGEDAKAWQDWWEGQP